MAQGAAWPAVPPSGVDSDVHFRHPVVEFTSGTEDATATDSDFEEEDGGVEADGRVLSASQRFWDRTASEERRNSKGHRRHGDWWDGGGAAAAAAASGRRPQQESSGGRDRESYYQRSYHYEDDDDVDAAFPGGVHGDDGAGGAWQQGGGGGGGGGGGAGREAMGGDVLWSTGYDEDGVPLGRHYSQQERQQLQRHHRSRTRRRLARTISAYVRTFVQQVAEHVQDPAVLSLLVTFGCVVFAEFLVEFNLYFYVLFIFPQILTAHDADAGPLGNGDPDVVWETGSTKLYLFAIQGGIFFGLFLFYVLSRLPLRRFLLLRRQQQQQSHHHYDDVDPSYPGKGIRHDGDHEGGGGRQWPQQEEEEEEAAAAVSEGAAAGFGHRLLMGVARAVALVSGEKKRALMLGLVSWMVLCPVFLFFMLVSIYWEPALAGDHAPDITSDDLRNSVPRQVVMLAFLFVLGCMMSSTFVLPWAMIPDLVERHKLWQMHYSSPPDPNDDDVVGSDVNGSFLDANPADDDASSGKHGGRRRGGGDARRSAVMAVVEDGDDSDDQDFYYGGNSHHDSGGGRDGGSPASVVAIDHGEGRGGAEAAEKGGQSHQHHLEQHRRQRRGRSRPRDNGMPYGNYTLLVLYDKQEGILYGLFHSVAKLSMALALVVSFFSLAVSGYQPICDDNVEGGIDSSNILQDQASIPVLWVICTLVSLLPFGALAVAAAALYFYPICRQSHEEDIRMLLRIASSQHARIGSVSSVEVSSETAPLLRGK